MIDLENLENCEIINLLKGRKNSNRSEADKMNLFFEELIQRAKEWELKDEEISEKENIENEMNLFFEGLIKRAKFCDGL